MQGTTNQIQRSYDLKTNNWVDFVRVVSATNSPLVTETILDLDPPSGMVFIPGGVFEMGYHFEEGLEPDERPLHSVYVSGFYMGKDEVTNDEMMEVMQWAYDNGKLLVTTASVKNVQGDQQELLDLDASACRITWNGSAFGIKSTKGINYPCVTVSWFGCAAYSNYRSEMEGKTPCYDLNDWSCNFDANGYRLSTEAEWEKGARGGLNGRRFGWGDTINHDHANYMAGDPNAPFDTSPYTTSTYHPDYDDGDEPFTSPVDAFPENGYGVRDMAGNTREWCNDWYDSTYYAHSPSSNPRGPATGELRIYRGGSWGYPAGVSRSANRYRRVPTFSEKRFGFRVVFSVK